MEIQMLYDPLSPLDMREERATTFMRPDGWSEKNAGTQCWLHIRILQGIHVGTCGHCLWQRRPMANVGRIGTSEVVVQIYRNLSFSITYSSSLSPISYFELLERRLMNHNVVLHTASRKT
jgi:hypothetical protein